jgi:hypothetical protein
VQNDVHRTGHLDVPADIMEAKLKVAVLFEVLDVVPPSGNEVIEAIDGVAQAQEFLTKMAADKARPTGDHDPQLTVLLFRK